MTLKTLRRLFRDTQNEWFADKAAKLAASLSFYTVFALAPLLVLITGVASLMLDSAKIQAQLMEQMKSFMSFEGSKLIGTLIENATKHEFGFATTFVGALTLFLGATGVFVELKDSLNLIWKVEAASSTKKQFLALIKDRVLSVIMILVTGFLLILSLVLSTTLAAWSKKVSIFGSGGVLLWSIANSLISITIITLLFAMMFKLLPDIKIAWSDVWIGSFLTSLLFAIGKSFIGFYLGRGVIGSVYGAAGSLAVLLLWVYYSSQIFFFGAEFTKVYSKRRGTLSGHNN